MDLPNALILAAGNLVPLAGVLFFGWQAPEILAMYWIETGVVGLVNILKIRRSVSLGPEGGGEQRIERGEGAGGWVLAIGWAGTYLLFWVILGIFVGQVVGGTFYEGASATGWTGVSATVVAAGTLSLVASQLFAYYRDYVRGRRYLTVTPLELLRTPFARIFALLGTITVGGVGIALLGASVGLIAVMVVAKTGAEVWWARTAPASPEAVTPLARQRRRRST